MPKPLMRKCQVQMDTPTTAQSQRLIGGRIGMPTAAGAPGLCIQIQ